MKTLTVALGERSYPIHIGAALLPRVGELIGDAIGPRAIVVTNATVAAYHLATLRTALAACDIANEVIVVPDGERYKDWATLQDILTRLLELRAERSTTLIALGGGVVGDLAGFAAAIYQRGMPFVQIPTTLLSQVDSSVGGKTGINHALGKNMVGAFWQPRAVLIDTECLRTIPPREAKAGLAEVIKYGAIRDAAFFAWLETNIGALSSGDADALLHAVFESCRIKADVVGADERESGERAILNFGHTFGHAIETAAGYGTWLHGEAVAAGMVCAARLSERVCHFDAAETTRLISLLAAAGLPVAPPVLPAERWLNLMGRDKKVVSGSIRFVLLERIGRALRRDRVPVADVKAAIAPWCASSVA